MASGIAPKKGKKNRKHGRWLRAPSMRRYVAENRWETNKRKRIERDRRRQEKARVKREQQCKETKS